MARYYAGMRLDAQLLSRNNHDGTFTEQGLERGVSLSEDGQEQAGMGLGIGDFDTDGYLDIFKTHFVDDTRVLYRNNGKGYFRDVTTRSGLGVETRFVGWGAGIVDLDNDGLPDLFCATGMVYPEVERELPDNIRTRRRASYFAILGAASSRNCWMRRVPAWRRSIAAAEWLSAISITMGTSTF